jgi:D-glycero-beta-D-manno-heptose-7-phosphate kinase
LLSVKATLRARRVPLGEITTLERLEYLRKGWTENGSVVVWTNGCYDLLHAGHVRNLKQAKEEGDILIVGVNSDASVRDNKGLARPIVPETERAEIVAALQCVDYVTIFDDKTPTAMLQRLRPDVHCKGADYADGRKPMPEADVVLGYGGRIAYMHMHAGCSTTTLIEKIANSNNPQLNVPNRIVNGHLSGGDSQDISVFAERIGRTRILVIGDLMLDEYVLGNVSRISPEAPVPIVDVSERRFTQGGAGNVAANVAKLGATVSLVGLIANDWAGELLREKLGSYGIQLDGIVVPTDRPTICKTRFVAGQQQIIRVDHESKEPLYEGDSREIIARAKTRLQQADICILSDYGKSSLSDDVCREIICFANTHKKPVIVDPKGRNYQKYRGCSVITPNTKEAGLAAGIEIESEEDLCRAAEILLDMLPNTAVLVTRGQDGMTLFRQIENPLTIRTIARSVFDVVGAGDTAVATLAVAIAAGCPIELAIKLANIGAGIAVEIHGTVAVSIEELINRKETIELLKGRLSRTEQDVHVA